MRTRTTLLAACLFVASTLNAQNFEWAKSFGGTSADMGYSIGVDASGNVYTIGYFEGTVDFNPGPGTANLTSTGVGDIFVQKIDAFGNFIWAKAFGGILSETGLALIVDASGNIYTTGTFQGTVDFDPGVGTANLTAVGMEDIFVQKMDASGNFLWAKSFGGIYLEQGFSINIDASGNVFTTGRFQETVDFDPGAGIANLTSAGYDDIFIQKMDASGNFLWAKSFGGADYDDGYSSSVDASGNVLTTGYFHGTVDFDPGVGTANLTAVGMEDIFVQKMDASGNFIWAKSFGSITQDIGESISVDDSGNVYTTGRYSGTADFDPGAGTTNLTSAGSYDIFVQKMDPSGNFIWAKSFGSISYDIGESISVDNSGNVYTTGYFQRTVDFDPGAGITNLTSVGSILPDIFVQKMDASGNLLWAKSFGDTLHDVGHSIHVDAAGNIYTTGYFTGTVDFDPGAGIANLTSVGGVRPDVFVQKMSQSTPTSTTNVFGKELKVYPNPTYDDIFVDLGQIYATSRLTITDMTGKLISSISVTQTQVVNLSIEEPVGVYILTINTDDKKAVIKVIKE